MIFAVIQIVLLVLFATEPCYNRQAIYNIDTTGESTLDQLAEYEKHEAHIITQDETADVSSAPNVTRPVRKSFVQRMSVFSGRFTDESLFKLCFTPFAVCLNPVIL